jgi:signal transduction histidine kinase
VSLTTRLVVFLQTAVTIVLVLFCVILYTAANWYVYAQAESGAQRALATLVASVDIEADSVEWEPSDREVSLGVGPLGSMVYWFITDARGGAVDRFSAPETRDLVADVGTGAASPPAVEGWIVSRKLIHPPGLSGPQLIRNRTDEEVEKGEYPALVFTTAVRTEPLATVLKTLAVGLAVVALTVWFTALGIARSVCQRALRPVTEMAEAARAMNADDSDLRLPPTNSMGELNDLHSAISGLLDRLHSALSQERLLTAEASHQLRTPLGTILGQIDVALRRPRSPEEYQRVLGVVRRQATDLVRSVEALLFLARPDGDVSPPVMEPMDLTQWLADYFESLGSHPRRVDFSLDLIPGRPKLAQAHSPLLRELIANLIDNALKYSPPGSPVIIRLTCDAGNAHLVVEDRGAGIAAADLPHLFKPFYRSNDTARVRVSGAGLGLAVVARIAAAFQGRVTVANRVDGGAGFTVILPILLDKEEFIPASPVP